MTARHESSTIHPVRKKCPRCGLGKLTAAGTCPACGYPPRGLGRRTRERAIFSLAPETIESIERIREEHKTADPKVSASRVVDAAVKELARQTPARIGRAVAEAAGAVDGRSTDRAAEKQASRDQDEADLKSGKKTLAQIAKENGAFSFPRERMKILKRP